MIVVFFSLLSLFVVPALKTQITGGRCWLPLKDFCTLHVVHSFIIISFYSIIIFCLRCDLISLNSSDWLSNHIRCNYLSLSLGADKRPSRIQMQTLYHLSVFFARQALWRLSVCVWVGVFDCICACVSYRLFIYIFNSTIWKWTHVHMKSWKQTMWKPPVFTPDSTCWHWKQFFTTQKQLMCICVAFSKPCRLILNNHVELVSFYMQFLSCLCKLTSEPCSRPLKHCLKLWFL